MLELHYFSNGGQVFNVLTAYCTWKLLNLAIQP
jgi:hypothetical protein